MWEQEEMGNVSSDLEAKKPTEILLAISNSQLPKKPMFLKQERFFFFLFNTTGRKQDLSI